jgi:hypothetical protein
MPITADTVWFIAGSSGLVDFSDGANLTGARNMAGGARAGRYYTYRAEHPTDKSIWENGYGLWNGTTLVRTVTASSSGAKINFAVAPVVLLTTMERDWAAVFDAMAFSGIQVNGTGEIDQPNAGALISGINGHFVECWAVNKSGTMVLSAQQTADAPPGFRSGLVVNVTTAQGGIGSGDFAVITHNIEGQRFSRSVFGNAAAQPVSIGFWVKANRTGTYSGALRNSAGNRSYPFSFTVNAANTWEWKTVTIPGDTAGTWGSGNSVGCQIAFTLAAGATFVGTANAWAGSNLLGVTGTINAVAATSDVFKLAGLCVLPGLELPSAERSSLIVRPLDHELMLVKRYFTRNRATLGHWPVFSPTAMYVPAVFDVPMRVSPTVSVVGGTFVSGATVAGTAFKDVTGVSWDISPQAPFTGGVMNVTTATITTQTYDRMGELSANVINFDARM